MEDRNINGCYSERLHGTEQINPLNTIGRLLQQQDDWLCALPISFLGTMCETGPWTTGLLPRMVAFKFQPVITLQNFSPLALQCCLSLLGMHYSFYVNRKITRNTKAALFGSSNLVPHYLILAKEWLSRFRHLPIICSQGHNCTLKQNPILPVGYKWPPKLSNQFTAEREEKQQPDIHLDSQLNEMTNRIARGLEATVVLSSLV